MTTNHQLVIIVPLNEGRKHCSDLCPLRHMFSSYNGGYSWQCGLSGETLAFDKEASAVLLRTEKCHELLPP